MKELTPRQREIWDLKRPVGEGGQGKTRPEIAALLGISEPVVGKTLTVIYKKLGLDGLKRGQEGRLTENARPEVAAAAIDAASDPLARTQREAIEKVNQELQAAGVPGKVSEAVVRRMLVKFGGVVSVKRQVTTSDILQKIDEELHLVSQYIDDKVAAEANLRDLGMFKAALIEKRQLLRGEPTQIVSDLERKKLNELLPLLGAELQRRGITIEGEVKTVHVEPENTPA